MTAILPQLDRFHLCSLMAAKFALSEGKLHDSEHVKRIAYELFEGGAFREEKAVSDAGPGIGLGAE